MRSEVAGLSTITRRALDPQSVKRSQNVGLRWLTRAGGLLGTWAALWVLTGAAKRCILSTEAMEQFRHLSL